MEALSSPLSSRPQRSAVEGSAVRPAALPNSPSQTSNHKQKCHPDRSEAKWRYPLFPSAPIESEWKRHPPLCHPDRSEAKRRDPLFPSAPSNLNGSATLPFVIPTGAKRSGGICGAPLGPPEFSVSNHNPQTEVSSRPERRYLPFPSAPSNLNGSATSPFLAVS